MLEIDDLSQRSSIKIACNIIKVMNEKWSQIINQMNYLPRVTF